MTDTALAKPAGRQFYSIPLQESNSKGTRNKGTETPVESSQEQAATLNVFESNQTKQARGSLLKYVSQNVIGGDKVFSGPFGLRKVVYLDFVASGRSLQFIEDYLNHEVLPEYGNTHTTTSVTSLQTTLFRHEARDILRNSFNASEHDSVIFTGSGSTGAIHKLIHALDLGKVPVIVFVGPYEHHSNILPWKEMGAKVIRISQTGKGHIDIHDLEQNLKSYQGGDKQLIGAFSAASNVTGILSDVDAITILLHKHGALAVWDFACAAPYVKIDMNPYIGGPDQPYVYKDAVVLSVHKFVGGTSTPGVLMAKKNLFKNPVPEGCGGGTVFFVRRENHRYLQEPESREEGGTPAIVESIRAGLVVQLKQAVGVETIKHRDEWLLSEAQKAWADVRQLIQLGPRPGPDSPDKLPIFSFLVLHQGTGRFLHHNFVAAVLNDVFGIQARGGCACAGPYAMDLLGLDEETAKRIEELIAEDSRLDRTHLRRMKEYSHREILRPGFVRLNLPYFIDEDCLKFVLEAVKMVAQEGWKLLPQYLFNPETAEWRQRHFQTFKDRKWLGHISYQSGRMAYHQPKQNIKGPLPTDYQDCLKKAQKVFDDASKMRIKIPDQAVMFDEEASQYRWFVLPSEANICLPCHKNSSSIPTCLSPDEMPFYPGREVSFHKLTNVENIETSKMSSRNNDDGNIYKSVEANDSQGKDEISLNEVNRFETFDKNNDTVSHPKEEMSGEVSNVPEKGGMLALQEALNYADSVLEETGSSKAVEDVGSSMASIWGRFDPKRSQGDDKAETKAKFDVAGAVDEIAQTMENIWTNFAPVASNKGLNYESKNLDEPSKMDLGTMCTDTPESKSSEWSTVGADSGVNSNKKETKIEAQIVSKGRILGLQNAVNYANTLLSTHGQNIKALGEVGDMMANIWTMFDCETSKVDQADETKDQKYQPMLNKADDSTETTPQESELSSSQSLECKSKEITSTVSDGTSSVKQEIKTNSPCQMGKVEADGPVNTKKVTEDSETTNIAELEKATPATCSGKMLALHNAVVTADSILAQSNSNSKASDEINDVMASIWQQFDPKNSTQDDSIKLKCGVPMNTVPSEKVATTVEETFKGVRIVGNLNDATKMDDIMKQTPSAMERQSEAAPVATGAMKSLHGAVQHAESLLASCSGNNKVVEEVGDVMASIWASFDTNSSQMKAFGETTRSVGKPMAHAAQVKHKIATQPMDGSGDAPSQTLCSAEDDHTLTNQAPKVENKGPDLYGKYFSSQNTDLPPRRNLSIKNCQSAIDEIEAAMNDIYEFFSPATKQTKPSQSERDSSVIGNFMSGATTFNTLLEAKNQLNSIWENLPGMEKDKQSSNEPIEENVSTLKLLDKNTKVDMSEHETVSDGHNMNHGATRAPIYEQVSTQMFSEGMISALSQGYGDKGEVDDLDSQDTDGNESRFVDQSSPSDTSTVGSSDTLEALVKADSPTSSDKKQTASTNLQTSQKEVLESNNLRPEKNTGATEDSVACPFLKDRGKNATPSTTTSSSPSAEVQWFAPPKQIFKPAVQALEEYNMLNNGDRVLVCLSGGKDSLSLLHTIRQYQFYARGKGVTFEFGAVTVDPMTPAYDPSPLKQYLASLKVPYFYESQCILETAEQLPYECASICSFCSRMKRGRIYAAARREGYNVLALGQHLDDLTESFLMSFFHNGSLNTMKAHYTIKKGDLRVIRPFVYVREADLRAFTEQKKLPIIAENCPACFEAPKERHRAKQLLAAQEVMFPQVYSSMMAALKPLMAREIGQTGPTSDLEREDGEE